MPRAPLSASFPERNRVYEDDKYDRYIVLMFNSLEPSTPCLTASFPPLCSRSSLSCATSLAGRAVAAHDDYGERSFASACTSVLRRFKGHTSADDYYNSDASPDKRGKSPAPVASRKKKPTEKASVRQALAVAVPTRRRA